MRKRFRVLFAAAAIALLGVVGVACESDDTLYHCGIIDRDQNFTHLGYNYGGRYGDTDVCYMYWDSTGGYAATCEMNVHDHSYRCYWA